MSSKRVFYLMIGLLGLLVVVNAAAVVGGTSMLSSASKELVDLKSKSQVQEDQQTALSKAQRDISENQDLDLAAQAIVPQDKDQAKAVREITAIAKKSKIVIQNISFANSTLGAAALATTSATTPATAQPTLTQVQPVPGLANVYQLQLNIQSDPNQPVKFSQFVSFLQNLELSRRVPQVSSINVTPGTNNQDKITFAITINLYVKK